LFILLHFSAHSRAFSLKDQITYPILIKLDLTFRKRYCIVITFCFYESYYNV
jgi:hypothetical protein